MSTATARITDIGPPDYRKFLPPVVTKNYGKWKYHEILKPGVMVHVGRTGDRPPRSRHRGRRGGFRAIRPYGRRLRCR